MIFRRNRERHKASKRLAKMLAGAITLSPLAAVTEDAIKEAEPLARQEQQIQLEQEKQSPISGFVEITPVSKYI